ncbi:MAG: hypothetical protein LW823_03250 [Rickettsiales bacterium]|jgi:hypothetical protein|nr:hypothetical protein [Rickettsiales bacterium]
MSDKSYVNEAAARKVLDMRIDLGERVTVTALQLIHNALTAGHFQSMGGGEGLEAFIPDRIKFLDIQTVRDIKRIQFVMEGLNANPDSIMTPPIEKTKAATAFGNYYHLLNDKTAIGGQHRQIVEDIFKILELGPIPPDPYKDRSTKPEKDGGTARA